MSHNPNQPIILQGKKKKKTRVRGHIISNSKAKYPDMPSLLDGKVKCLFHKYLSMPLDTRREEGVVEIYKGALLKNNTA